MSRKPEQLAWDNFSGAAPKASIKFHRVENLCVTGMSDVIGINMRGTVFWIENKAISAWPVRPTTKPVSGIFERGQLPFLRQWKWWRGHAFVLLRVGVSFYLIDPEPPIEEQTAAELLAGAVIAVGKPAIYEHLERL